MEKDPVCGMPVEQTGAAQKATYLGKTFYFCLPGCHKVFTAQPKKYAEAAARESSPGGGTKPGRWAAMRVFTVCARHSREPV